MNTKLSHIDDLYLPPYSLNLITTDYCTASCQNCCFKCSPKNNHQLSYEEMKIYIDNALNSFPTIKLLILTGGECFSLKDDLKKIINYGNKKGLNTRVVTNCYWASSFKKAYIKLKELTDAGLKEINISTGDEHLVWVAYDNIVYATIAALKLNLTIVINVETCNTSNFTTDNIYNYFRIKTYLDVTKNHKLKIIGGKWIQFRSSSNSNNNSKDKNSISNRYLRCDNLLSSITITPYHKMLACCGLSTKYISYLEIGDTKKYPLKFLHKFQLNDFIKIWLFTEGPKKILEFCQKHGNTNIDISIANWHTCQACNELFKDPKNISIINENYNEVLTNIILKYNFLRESYIKQLQYI